MKLRAGKGFIVAVITGVAIALFQAGWLYQSFKTSADNFVQTASNDLQKSVNAYQLAQNARLLNSGAGGDSLTTLFVSRSANHQPLAKDWKEYKTGLSIPNRQMLRTLMSGMLSQVINNPIAMKKIAGIYRLQLIKDGIGLGFSFTVLPNSRNLNARQVRAVLELSANSPVVVANFSGTNGYLIQKNGMPLLVSLLLLLLTFGCLWYMHSVIAQQARLDQIKNDFINNMAHEFRTPVAILRSTHEALIVHNGLDDREKSLRYLKADELVLRKMENDLDRILTLAPFERHRPGTREEEIAVNTLLNELMLPYTLSGDLTFEITNKIPDTVLKSDRYMVGSILSNLIDNAVKYGGTTIKIGFYPSDDAISWHLRVGDNGRGIDPAHLPYIFDKFYRAPQGDRHDTKGFGLGLSYVQQLTRLLGGSIAVDSQPGKGTTFLLTIPWKK